MASVEGGAKGLGTGLALALRGADVADESDGLGPEEASEKLRSGELVLALVSVLVWAFV